MARIFDYLFHTLENVLIIKIVLRLSWLSTKIDYVYQ